MIEWNVGITEQESHMAPSNGERDSAKDVPRKSGVVKTLPDTKPMPCSPAEYCPQITTCERSRPVSAHNPPRIRYIDASVIWQDWREDCPLYISRHDA